jgi:S-DNA-T family DNA segregation ATPase FtsK/SpoIIIE
VKPMTKRAGIRTGSQPVVAIIDRGLIYQERLRVPLWLSVLGVTLRLLARLVVRLVRVAARQWPFTLVLLAAGCVWVRLGVHGLLTAAVLATLVLGAVLAWWWLLRPASFARLVAEPMRGLYRWHRVYRWRWREAMDGTGLIVRHDDTEHLPQVEAIRSNGTLDTLRLRLAAGQTPQDVADAAEGLRHIYRALRCAVREDGPGWVLVRFFVRDPLLDPIPPAPLPNPPSAALPVPAQAVALDADTEPPLPLAPSGVTSDVISGVEALAVLRTLQLGRSEDGTPWLLNLVATHVLVAGSTGAGKGSVLWSLVRLLAPLIRAGLVALWVVDPKGGMEFRAGQPLFARYEDSSPEGMVGLLEDAAAYMDARADRLAGITRSHVPTVDDPFVIVLVDEVADLTAHNPDRGLKQRSSSALSRLLAKGRAPGFAVVAAVVDPRKDVIPFRDLFPTRIAMRLAEPEQTDLVLGEAARDRGADASTIPRSLPGVAYVHDDTSADPAPVRVRFSFVTDDDIAALVADHIAAGVETLERSAA